MLSGRPARMILGLLVVLVLGSAAHMIFGESPILAGFVRYGTEPAGKIFLRLLFMLVIPLIVSALAMGVAGLGDLRSLGRIGLKTLAYTVVVSTLAVLLGVGMVNLFQPGRGLPPDLRAKLLTQASAAPAAAPAAGATGVDFVVNLVPNNVVKAMADGDMLAVMVFALLLGIGISVTRNEPARRLQEALEGLYEVVMHLLDMVLRVAPLAVACLLFTLTARVGMEVVRQIGDYLLIVLVAIIFLN